MKRLTVAVAAALLSGCASVSEVSDAIGEARGRDYEALKSLTRADFATAIELAELADDKASLLCLPVLEDRVMTIIEVREQGKAAVGLVSQYQRARNLRRLLLESQAVTEDVHLACSAMLNDSGSVLRKILRAIGVGF